MRNKKRIEFDSLGPKKIDKDRLWGAQTQRSIENFKIGNERMPKEVIIALGQQKKAAAQANMQLGILNKKIGNLIIDACNQIINLKLIDEFNINGDFIESQAFAFLAIRSIKKLPISFPNTTNCSRPISGGEIVDN